MKALLASLSLATLMANPLSARVWTAPEGCEVFMTVQTLSCSVSNYYRCEGDAQGDQWRADFDQEGIFFRSRINFETEWVESFDINPPDRQTLVEPPKDRASFSDLIAKGRDDFEFSLQRESGLLTMVHGFDQLTGKEITIDGVPLLQTEFDFTELDGEGNQHRRGRGFEYVSPEMRLFFSGPSEVMMDGEWLAMDASPIDFIYPGEKGFASSQPLYDCDALTAQNSQTLRPILAAHPQMTKGQARPAPYQPASPKE